MIEASPLATYLLDPEGRVRLWNAAAERVFGWSEAEVLGRTDPTLPTANFAEMEGLLTETRAGAAIVQRRAVRSARGGDRLEVSISAAAVSDSEGGPLGMMVIVSEPLHVQHDDDERRALLHGDRIARYEAEAAEHRARFLAEAGALLDGTLDYTATLNNLAQLAVDWMADYCLLDAIEGDELVRVALAFDDPRLGSYLQREGRQPLNDDPAKHPVLRVVLTGEPVLVEDADDEVLADISHDTEHFDLLRRIGLRSFIVVPLGTHGKILGAITLAYAASGRRYSPPDLQMAAELGRRAAMAVEAARLYRESRLAVEARERFLAVVSHDLRNALATVLLNASAMLDAADETVIGRYRDPIRWINRSAEQMNRLISDLLDLSSIEKGRLSVEPVAHAVASLLQDAMDLYGPLAAERQMTIRVELLSQTPYVAGDGERLQQVLGNLIGNALKFSPPGSEVVLRAASSSPDDVRFEVADQGSGIEPERQTAIFDPYWQGESGAGRGAGLGLAIAKGIIEAHGGRIWVNSAPRKGSTFCFTLPGISSLGATP